MLFRGPSINGVYPFPSSLSPTPPVSQVAFICVLVNKNVWHSRLGHLASSILHRSVSSQHLALLENKTKFFLFIMPFGQKC